MTPSAMLERPALPVARPNAEPRAAQDSESAHEHAQPMTQSRAQTLPPANGTTQPIVCSRAEDQNLEPANVQPQTKRGPRARTAPSANEATLPKGQAQTGQDHPFRTLRIWAEMFEDVQKTRIATENRAQRGGLDPETYTPQLATLAAAEHAIELALRKTYRAVCPQGIRVWQQEEIGIGEHLLARLLGVIGHPIHTTVYHWEIGDERVLVEDGAMERRVSDLWSYCGHGDAARRRQKGMSADDATALGNPRAKVIVRLLAVSCVKQGRGQYEAVYRARRALTEEGRPDWSPLRKHNDALRITGKAILKDLWVAGGAS